MNKKLFTLIISALMAALTCIATMVIHIPTPALGYIHFGDGMVLLSGILLGPVYGSLAAGIGSMLADVFSGYMGFAPATLIIKALAAFAGGSIYHLIMKHPFRKGERLLGSILGGLGGGAIVVSGYYIFSAFILGMGPLAALVDIPFNLVQTAFGIIGASLLLPVMDKVPTIKERLNPRY